MSIFEEYGAFKSSPYDKGGKQLMLDDLYLVRIAFLTHTRYMRNWSFTPMYCINI